MGVPAVVTASRNACTCSVRLQRLLSVYVNQRLQIPVLDTVYIAIQMQIIGTGDEIGTLESIGAPKGGGGCNPIVTPPPKSEI
jgi:hypothetical protein